MKRMVTDGFQYISNCVNMFELYGVTEFLSAFGLYVHPDFRGQGLGTEILRTRTNLGKALGLKVTMSFFTTTQGQRSAEKAGMKLLAEVPYAVFTTEDGKEVYTNMNPKTLKIMAMRLA
jgi:GNAT superfamily N-acetyltransferase